MTERDFDWPALTDSQQAQALRDMLADAWDEGYEQRATDARRFRIAPTHNPYRGS